tara:strand:+ start:6638 stop:7321 length:684 start_codon:yes stop_codon:yes gene_type:complete
MAVTYESFLPEIIASAPGCPDTLIERHVRSAVIDMCEKTDIYQVELDPVTAIANTHEYDLEPPKGTVVHRIRHVLFDGNPLEPTTSTLLEQRNPKWRTDSGTPEYFIKEGQSLFWLVPTPSATQASAIILRVVLKPTRTSTACDDYIMNDFHDVIVNGTLTRLLRMPGQDWTDYNAANIYNTLYMQGLVEAEKIARSGDMPVAAKTNYGGIHKGRSKRKYAGRRTFF